MDEIFMKSPGAGIIFLAKCISYESCSKNIKALFTTNIGRINHLIAAEEDRSLLKKRHYYKSPGLFVCDSIDYLFLVKQGSHLFFQVISKSSLR